MKRLDIIILVALATFLGNVANAVEFRPLPMFGMKVAYINKFFRGHHNGGGFSNLNCWGRQGSVDGLHFGITVEPYFGKGMSLSTGVFYEYYRCKNDFSRWTAHEHVFYIPAHAKFTLPVSNTVAIYALAGPAISWGMNLKLTHGGDDDLSPHFDTAGWPRRLQLLAEGGLGVAWRKIALEIIYGVGMLREDSMPQGLYSSIRQQKLTLQLEVKF